MYNVYEIDASVNENNVVTSAVATCLFRDFSSIEDITEFFHHIPNRHQYSDLTIMKMDGRYPVACEGVIFSFGKDWMFDVAEWDYRVIAEVAFHKNFNT